MKNFVFACGVELELYDFHIDAEQIPQEKYDEMVVWDIPTFIRVKAGNKTWELFNDDLNPMFLIDLLETISEMSYENNVETLKIGDMKNES